MADQPYLSWSHALVSGAACRTPIERATDVFNVQNYYHTADSGDWQPAIQRAVDASTSGGIVFFPPGTYNISQKITLPNDQAERAFLGCGRSTIISGNFDHYLLYNAQVSTGSSPVALISGLSFTNNYALAKASFTTPDPIDQPGGSATGACGCIYLPNSSFVEISNCSFTIASGVAVYFPGINNKIRGGVINGGFSGATTAPISIGIWASSVEISNMKVYGCRYGIVTYQNPAYIHDMDIELCYTGWIAHTPYPNWDRNTNTIMASGQQALYQIMDNIQFEDAGSQSEGGVFINLDRAATGSISNVRINSLTQGFIDNPEYGIKLGTTAGFNISSVDIGGKFTIACVGYAGGVVGSNSFRNVGASVASGGGVPWVLPTTQYNDGYGVDQYFGTLANGAMPLSRFPATQIVLCTSRAVCSDSVDPVWASAGTSNVGKPIVGGGTYTVNAQYTEVVRLAATASWTTGTPNITMTANPSSVVKPGARVYDVTNSLFIGVVLTFSGTALVLNANAANASSGSTDTLSFQAWTIAG